MHENKFDNLIYHLYYNKSYFIVNMKMTDYEINVSLPVGLRTLAGMIADDQTVVELTMESYKGGYHIYTWLWWTGLDVRMHDKKVAHDSFDIKNIYLIVRVFKDMLNPKLSNAKFKYLLK